MLHNDDESKLEFTPRVLLIKIYSEINAVADGMEGKVYSIFMRTLNEGYMIDLSYGNNAGYIKRISSQMNPVNVALHPIYEVCFHSLCDQNEIPKQLRDVFPEVANNALDLVNDLIGHTSQREAAKRMEAILVEIVWSYLQATHINKLFSPQQQSADLTFFQAPYQPKSVRELMDLLDRAKKKELELYPETRNTVINVGEHPVVRLRNGGNKCTLV